MTTSKGSSTSLRFSGAHPTRRHSRTYGTISCIWAASGVGVASLNQTASILRFFFRVTLKRHDIVEHTHFIREPRKLPVVLSPDEVACLLDAAPGLKYKAALSVAYGAGLRANEVISLKVCDIDGKRMLIRVEQGKGGKDRYVMPHRTCSTCCVRGGRQRGRGAGSFRAATRCSR